MEKLYLERIRFEIFNVCSLCTEVEAPTDVKLKKIRYLFTACFCYYMAVLKIFEFVLLGLFVNVLPEIIWGRHCLSRMERKNAFSGIEGSERLHTWKESKELWKVWFMYCPVSYSQPTRSSYRNISRWPTARVPLICITSELISFSKTCLFFPRLEIDLFQALVNKIFHTHISKVITGTTNTAIPAQVLSSWG